jgi:hypothetical protein
VDELRVEPGGTPDEPTVDAEGRRRGGIDGVATEQLSRHVDHRGSLFEIVNFDHPSGRSRSSTPMESRFVPAASRAGGCTSCRPTAT